MSENDSKYNVYTKSFFISIIISLFIGAFIFIAINGVKVIDYSNTDWLLVSDYGHDLEQHFVGWEFFRSSPWMFPLGLFDTLSYPYKVSVIYIDAIPLFAIFFKMLSPVLPQNFQYFGIWGVICYMLQSCLGMVISKKYTPNNFLGYFYAIIAGTLFTLVPVLTHAILVHGALNARWVLLLAFLPIIYFKELSQKSRIVLWGIIGFLSVFIHPYILAMTGIIFLGYILYSYLENKKIDIKSLAIFSIVILFSLYICGFFNTNMHFDVRLFREFEFSSFILNSDFIKHYRLPGNYYDFDLYLGYGFFALFFTMLFKFLFSLLNRKKEHTKLDSFALVMFSLIIVSMATAIIPKFLYYFQMLDKSPYIDNFIRLFGATFRFCHIAFYSLIIVAIRYLALNFKLSKAVSILIICVFVQICEFIPYYIARNHYYNRIPTVHSCLSNRNWARIFKVNKIKYIKTVFLEPELEDFVTLENYKYFNNEFSEQMNSISKSFIFDFAYFAHKNNLIFSNYYFARKTVNDELYQILDSSDDNSLYIFMYNYSLKIALNKKKFKYAYLIDGLYVLSEYKLIGANEFLISIEELKNKIEKSSEYDLTGYKQYKKLYFER